MKCSLRFLPIQMILWFYSSVIPWFYDKQLHMFSCLRSVVFLSPWAQKNCTIFLQTETDSLKHWQNVNLHSYRKVWVQTNWFSFFCGSDGCVCIRLVPCCHGNAVKDLPHGRREVFASDMEKVSCLPLGACTIGKPLRQNLGLQNLYLP